MLLELTVQDFALIDRLRLEFSDGLNILTGETGAGKSIIIDSVSFVLGGRSSKDIIRTGTDKTEVQAVFTSIDSPEFIELIQSYGIESDDGIIILSRELNTSGKGMCRINGKALTSSVLKNIGNYLLDIHGQHEHQSLLNEENHIDMLDMFGGSSIFALKEEVKNIYGEVQHIKQQLKSMQGDDYERERKLSLLDYQIREIDDAKLITNEEEELLTERNILNNAGKIFSVLSKSYNSLYAGEDGNASIFDRIGYILSELRGISNIDERIDAIYKNIEDAYYTIESSVGDLRSYRDKIDFNPERIEEIETRLDLINKLKRKYGKTIADILNYRNDIYNEKQEIENSEEIIEKLKSELKDKIGILDGKCASLSRMRKAAAKKLEDSILNELKFLGMEKSKFQVEFNVLMKDNTISYNEKGFDIIRFLMSANLGEPLKPLSKIASGGEISRIMLAIKTVLADTDRIPSLIFDEIDTGISGRAAQAVAEKLGQISKNHQVICVTHLPQIASMADAHFYISKSEVSGKTKTSVESLDNAMRVKEIARMLGGAKLTELTIKHARKAEFLV